MMKCPYFYNIKQKTEVKREYDPEGHETRGTTVFGEEQHPTDCFASECGAYKDGRCCYKSS